MSGDARGGDDTLTAATSATNVLVGDAYSMSDDARGGETR